MMINRAKELYEKARKEVRRAEELKDPDIYREACAKAWLSVLEATKGFLIKKGVKEEELPNTDRGWRILVGRHASPELRYLFSSLRADLHVDGYYGGGLSKFEIEQALEDLRSYTQMIERV